MKGKILFAAVVFVLLAACEKGQVEETRGTSPAGAGRIRVVTTIGMISDVVANVGGERVQVKGLMGPGVDPHLYKASEGDVQRMAEAQIVFYNGLHLEGRMTDLFEQMGRRMPTVAVTDPIERSLLLAPPGFEGAYDPHVWFDVSLWMKTVERVRSALSDLDPEQAGFFQTNEKAYLEKLAELHAYVGRRAQEVPEGKRVLITAHDAFNYFGRAYGFEVRGLQGISTASEAGTGDVQTLAGFIVERRIPAIFVETSVPQRTIEALKAAARSRGFGVEIGGQLYSDAMGASGTSEGTYIGMVRHNIDTIVGALSR